MLLQELSLDAFRGVRSLRLEKLARVNLLVGANNSGKTSVLEAASLIARPFDQAQWARILQSRDLDARSLEPESVWSMFPDARSLSFLDGPPRCEPMALSGTFSQGVRSLRATATAQETGEKLADNTDAIRVLVRAELQAEGEQAWRNWQLELMRGSLAFGGSLPDEAAVIPYRAVLLSPIFRSSTQGLVPLLSHAVKQGQKKRAIELLQLVDPDVEDVEMIQFYGQTRIQVMHKRRGSADLASFGDGMRQALALAVAVTTARGGLLLIDELEAGIHHKLLVGVLRLLLLASQQSDVQVFCTTHSLEAVDALIEAAQTTDLLPEISAFWLKREAGGHAVQRFSGDRLLGLREEGLDIR